MDVYAVTPDVGGGTATATLEITSPASGNSAGAYGVSVKATGMTSSLNATGSATYTLTCSRAAPSVVISPSSQSGTAGTLKSYTATVTNNDDTSCSSNTFDLTADLPTGWSGGLSAASLSIAGGASDSVTLDVTSPASGGTLGANSVSVTATAQTGGASAAGSASYVLQAPTPDAGVPDLSLPDLSLPDAASSPDSVSSPCGSCAAGKVCCFVSTIKCYGKCVPDCNISGTCPNVNATCDTATGLCLPAGVVLDSGVTPDAAPPVDGPPPMDAGSPSGDLPPPPADAGPPSGDLPPPPTDAGPPSGDLPPPPTDAGSPSDAAQPPADSSTSPCGSCTSGKVCCDVVGLPCYGQCIPDCRVGGQCPTGSSCDTASGICMPPNMGDGAVPPPTDGLVPPVDGSTPPVDGPKPPVDGPKPPDSVTTSDATAADSGAQTDAATPSDAALADAGPGAETGPGSDASSGSDSGKSSGGGDSGGCSCQVSASPSGSAWLLSLALLVLRRRRGCAARR